MSLLFDENKKLTYGIKWLLISLFCGIFSMIYKHFSFGVISYSMVFLFAFPLFLGALPCMVLQKMNYAMPNRIYQDGIVILTLMSLVNGILEIYGTSTHFIRIYLIIGIACIVLGMLFYMIQVQIKNLKNSH